jgi:hypothetical protein
MKRTFNTSSAAARGNAPNSHIQRPNAMDPKALAIANSLQTIAGRKVI